MQLRHFLGRLKEHHAHLTGEQADDVPSVRFPGTPMSKKELAELPGIGERYMKHGLNALSLPELRLLREANEEGQLRLCGILGEGGNTIQYLNQLPREKLELLERRFLDRQVVAARESGHDVSRQAFVCDTLLKKKYGSGSNPRM